MADSIYTLPSGDLALGVLQDDPALSSGLSDAPSDIDDSNIGHSSGADFSNSPPEFRYSQDYTPRRKRSFSTFAEDSLISENETICSGLPKVASIVPRSRDLVPIETAPAEVLQNIAACSKSDIDLTKLQLASRKITYNVSADDSSVWKDRFLAKYDHPIIECLSDFSHAYKLRRLILNANNFVDFRDGKDQRLDLQLEAIKDMIVETFNRPQLWSPTPRTSKNLACFSSPRTSPWVINLLSSPFYNYGSRSFGEPNELFDAVQLTLSHLLLSPKPRTTHVVQAARDHYDIVRVYNWNQSFSLLFTRLPESQQEKIREIERYQSSKFPNLKSPSPEPLVRKIKYHLDTYSLLHIRNFWHRHLIDMGNSYITAAGARENTYASMAKDLLKLGHTPHEWTAPLQDPEANLKGILGGKWYGHYSCLQPWPKKKSDLEERQTCAEDWTEISPFKLDFAAFTDNTSFNWPPLFSTIPACETTTPDPTHSAHPAFFIRGIAPFIDLAAELKHNKHSATPTPSSRKTSATSQPQYHPYLSMRIRGIIHPIEDQADIPGWHRIIMVLFKPRSHYLIQVLAHAEEDYGSSFSVSVSAQMQQTTVQAILSGSSQIDPLEAEKHLKAYLDQKIAQVGTDGNVEYSAESMTRERIEELETGFSAGEHLTWDDMEYAYAYEGVIVPGGSLMMGRWWRIGEVGLGEGKEVNCEGESVVVGDEEGDGAEGGDGNGGDERRQQTKGLERGVFCFWC